MSMIRNTLMLSALASVALINIPLWPGTTFAQDGGQVRESTHQAVATFATSIPPGIPIFTGDQAARGWTEASSEYRLSKQLGVEAGLSVFRHVGQSMLRVDYEVDQSASFGTGPQIEFAVAGQIDQAKPIPARWGQAVSGVNIGLLVPEAGPHAVEILGIGSAGQQLYKQLVEFEPGDETVGIELAFDATHLCRIVVSFADQPGASSSVMIDYVSMRTEPNQVFEVPLDDNEFLDWVKRTSIGYFLDHYRSIDDHRGVVLEMSQEQDRVSLSGIGYAFAAYVIASEEGYIEEELARERIAAMLRWLAALNTHDGSGGWHGFPHHYFTPEGDYKWPDVSTIDWAICAIGIRLVAQVYEGDAEIVRIAQKLLDAADWSAALADDGRIAMGFDGLTGDMNPYRWGLAFSEETDLVYAEAMASGKLDETILNDVERIQKSGYYPSWFGAGFTYNWLQLWVGVTEPYASNSVLAYREDAEACRIAFGRPLMGLTACTTVGEFNATGFLDWDRYISNQGPHIHGTDFPEEVIRYNPAPYGAALALPFQKDMAIRALREYARMGFAHPHLGLPDAVRITELPAGFLPASNWNQVDINIGPMGMAVEQVQENRIARYLQGDSSYQEAIKKLITNWQ